MLRLLVDRLTPGPLELAGDDHHYLVHVRRLGAGDRLVLFDGQGLEATAEVGQVGARELQVIVGLPVAAAAPAGPAITVLLSLIKGDRMDLCLAKLVELGVSRIVPVAAERSVVRLDAARADRRHQRFRAIARAAAQQCRSAHLTAIDPVRDLDGALAEAAGASVKLVFWEEARSVPLRSALPAGREAGSVEVALLVGPEGGLTAGEVERAEQAGFSPVGLGPRILRADTAAVAAAAILAYALGEI